jgi:dTDP-4-dehydrorhamnose 3,5-epimerase
MTLEVSRLAIEGPLLIAPDRHVDPRGFFSETYNAHALADAGVREIFVQDNHSMSRERGTVRGLHYQVPPSAQAKLVRVTRGLIFDVFVDIRKSSPTYGQYGTVELGEENWQQLYVPVGFAHGFCTLEPTTEVIYKTTEFYSAQAERGIRWNDPELAINWPACAGASLSPKDLSLPMFETVNSPFIYAG